METENEDADIAILKEVLADQGRYGDDCEEVVEQFENVIISEEGNNLNDNDDAQGRLSHSYIDLDEIELDKDAPAPRMCRALGSAYYDLLYITEKQLQTLLDKCRTKIKDVQDRIDVIRNQGNVSRNNWYYMFGIPYFKDRRYFPCPPNEDHLRRLASKELNILDLTPLRQWKGCYKMKLEEAIKSEEIKNQMSDVKCKSQIQNEVVCLKDKTLAELVGFRKSEYDWMKISVQVMENYYSPEECRAMWHHYLHPMINKSKWDAVEDEKLIQLVNVYKNQNWDLIAEELGTLRSGYQCMCQYQTRLNDKLRKSKWTKEEDDYLREVVDFCRVGSYIPWAKVTSYMDGRSKNQVFNRWAYSLDPNIKRGRFTEEEDMLIVAAVRRYGTDNFKRVVRFLPGRTSIQVRDRYNSYLKFQTTGERWTPHDDSALMELVERYGQGNWSKISQHFNNRSRTQVRHRFATIQSWMKKMQSSNGELSVPTRKLNVEDNREEKVWSRVQKVLRGMKSSLEMNETNLLKLKEKLHIDNRKRPGRKVGQKKVLSKIEKEYYSFFRCVYTQFGGRRKQHFDKEVTQNITQAVQVMLQHFEARIKIPKNNYAIKQDCVLDESDRVILHSLRDGLVSAGVVGTGTQNMITEIEKSVSDGTLNVAESLASSVMLEINPECGVISNESFGLFEEQLSSMEGENGNDTASNSGVSSFQLNSTASEAESSSLSTALATLPGAKLLRTYGKQLSPATTSSNTSTNTIRTYGKQSSNAITSSVTTSFRTYGKQSVTTVNGEETEVKGVVLNRPSIVLNETLNSPENSSVVEVVLPSSSATFPTNVISNDIATTSSESSVLNVANRPVRIPYLCPPNHTTLVGFRTLLLSRRNILKIAELASKDIPSNRFIPPDSKESNTEDITPSTASLLWKERLFSLFVWPAVMSNVVPLMMDHVFKTENTGDLHGDEVGEASTSDNVAGKAKKKKRNVGKKRKYHFAKKKEGKVPPEKKRKYDRTGKFKRQTLPEPRRSVRRYLNSTDDLTSTNGLNSTDDLDLISVKEENFRVQC